MYCNNYKYISNTLFSIIFSRTLNINLIKHLPCSILVNSLATLVYRVD